jgi:uncharacterized protein (DUF1015 family)
MSVARAFPFLRYNPDMVGDPGDLLAPPYDVISDQERAQLATRSPYQSVLVELPEGGDPEAAAHLLQRWVAEDVLEGDYGVAVVQQRYVGPDGVRRTRLGVACEVELHDFADGVVLPHERTFEAPRRARQELMRVTQANVSPVFLAYHDPERSLYDLFASCTDVEPDFTATDADGTQTAVWFVQDLAICEQFEAAVADHPLLIADGHHRYTAALAYRDEVRAGSPHLSVVGGREHAGPEHTTSSGPDGVLAILCNSADPGMMVFPTHRIFEGVHMSQLSEFILGSGAFTITPYSDVATAVDALDHLVVPGFVVHHASGSWVYALADPVDMELAVPGSSEAYRSLDVTALHDLVIDGGALLGQVATATRYTRSLDEALDLVAAGDDRIGFLMRGVAVDAIYGVARAGELLPQKSTYFYPKVPTGVVFRQLAP